MIQIQRTLDYERNAARAGFREPCIRCGRGIKDSDLYATDSDLYATAAYMVHMTTSWRAVPTDWKLLPTQDQGWFAIGPECAKLLPPEYVAGPDRFGRA